MENNQGWTPGPWNALTDTIHSAHSEYAGQQVADCSMRQRGAVNAARIVQCVNSHDALVEALGSVICDGCHNLVRHDPTWPGCFLCASARAVLAKAQP